MHKRGRHSTVQLDEYMNTLNITENQCQHEREVIFSVFLPIIKCLKNTEINYEKIIFSFSSFFSSSSSSSIYFFSSSSSTSSSSTTNSSYIDPAWPQAVPSPSPSAYTNRSCGSPLLGDGNDSNSLSNTVLTGDGTLLNCFFSTKIGVVI